MFKIQCPCCLEKFNALKHLDDCMEFEGSGVEGEIIETNIITCPSCSTNIIMKFTFKTELIEKEIIDFN